MIEYIFDIYLMKAFFLSVLILFIFFGMDIRKKNIKTKKFVRNSLITLMKLSAIILLFLFLIGILFVNSTNYIDVIALLLSASGVGLIIWAKKALGKNFTWTGYYIPEAEIVTTGPYRFVNHPLYIGVFAFEIGASMRYLKFVAQTDHQIMLFSIGAVPLLYAISFNVIMSIKEVENLRKK